MTTDNVNEKDRMLTSIKVSNHVQRLSRSIQDRKYWKAIEWENWVLYYSIPILLTFPYLNLYVKHWSLLVQSYYITLKENISRNEIIEGNDLLTQFVTETKTYYSRRGMTHNIH